MREDPMNEKKEENGTARKKGRRKEARNGDARKKREKGTEENSHF